MKPLLAVLDRSEGLPELKLALLEVICERFPPDTTWSMADTLEVTCGTVEVIFSCTSHSVSHLGFLLLEEVELVSGSSPNLEVASTSFQNPKGPLLLALSRRLSSQQEQELMR